MKLIRRKTNHKQLKAKDIPIERDRILKEQGGVCCICKSVPKRPCLDHSHKKGIKGTGLVRGVLCSSCNIFLAKSENNASRYGFSQKELPDILRSVAIFLEKDHHPLIHPSEAPKPKKLMKSSYNKLHKMYKADPCRSKFPSFPKSGKMIKALDILYYHYNLKPEFYK